MDNYEQSLRTHMEGIFGRLTSIKNNRGAKVAASIARRLLLIMPDPQGQYKGAKRMRKEYKISLKIDFDDSSRHKIALHMMRKAARHILTQACLIADDREPQVAFESEDFFEGGTIESLKDLAEIPEDPLLKDEEPAT